MENKIKKIYQRIIYGIVLTKEVLETDGFTESEIQELVDTNVLRMDKDEKYHLTSAKGLYQYGVELLVNQKPIESRMCFRKSHDIDPNDKEICLQLFLIELKMRRYKDAIRMFNKIESISTPEDKYDNNLYLYLLSYITELPEEYAIRVKTMDFDDLVEISPDANPRENYIRRSVVKSKFTFAFQKTTELLHYARKYNPRYEVLKELFLQTLIQEKEFKKSLLVLSKKGQYEEILNLLSKKQTQKQLSVLERTIYMLVKNIINIQTNRLVPSVNRDRYKTTYDAIAHNDFNLAKELNDEFLYDKKETRENDTISILLDAILELISEIELEEPEPLLSTEEVTKEQQCQEETPTFIEYNQELKETEELAYYLQSENISIKDASKNLGIRPEQILLIKLIYARDYYIESNYVMGDLLVKEVSASNHLTPKIMAYLSEVKQNRNEYKNKLNIYIRKKSHQ